MMTARQAVAPSNASVGAGDRLINEVNLMLDLQAGPGWRYSREVATRDQAIFQCEFGLRRLGGNSSEKKTILTVVIQIISPEWMK